MASVLRSVLSDTNATKVGEMAQAENIAPPCEPGTGRGRMGA